MLHSYNPEFPQLTKLLRSGDPSKFEKLYDHYAPALYGWILKSIPDQGSAEELLCRTFQKVIECIELYKPEKCGFLTWLIQISNKEIQSYKGNHSQILRYTSSSKQTSQISIQTGA
jgi:DNA-directed RNA polymerase specialized sigma24 family protein